MTKAATTWILLGLTALSVNLASCQGGVRESQKASVTQFVGKSGEITIVYGRPSVKGRTIWGDVVPYGLAPGNKYSNNNPYPWRAGANEATTIEFNQDVKVGGQALPAGKYSVHMIPTENQWTVIFNKNTELWGSYQYDQKQDALRVTVTPSAAPFSELLTYGFEDISAKGTTAYLHWDQLKVPFRIEL